MHLLCSSVGTKFLVKKNPQNATMVVAERNFRQVGVWGLEGEGRMNHELEKLETRE